MKFIHYFSIVTLLLLSAFSCEEEVCCEIGPDEDTIYGEWLLSERGYSPGAGYITEDVDKTPAQIINLLPNGIFSTNIEGLDQFSYFGIVNDSQTNQPILALFTSEPLAADLTTQNFNHSYIVELNGNRLKLYYRFCIEGCHLGFEKVVE